MRHLWTAPLLMLVAGSGPYHPPKDDGPVLVLLDEDTDALYPLLTNVSGEPGTIAREETDAFAGVEAVRVTPVQKYMAHLPGWRFSVVEDPEEGEYRYVRFAWKKHGGSGVMIQFHDALKQGWGLRYYAGHNATGWGSKSVGEKLPTDWQVITRDLFNDFGTVCVTGIAFTPMDGEVALFDHILLGRTIADLDRATNEALGRVRRPLEGTERDRLWDDLIGADRTKAAAALRAFLAAAPDQVGYIRDRLPKPDAATLTRVRRLIGDLDADSFFIRQKATNELIRIGNPALGAVRQAATSPNPEVRRRAEQVLDRLAGDRGAARVVRVLERAATRDARELLTRLADGEYGTDYVDDATAALARLK